MSLSKSQLKLINSLQQKKYRSKHNLFVAEGTKVVNEFLNSEFKLVKLFCVNDSLYESYSDITVISDSELRKISNLKTPNNVLALFEIPKPHLIKEEGLIVVLDEINDPGNLGTIIRLCDWFGVNQLICSKNTVDCYNRKVVQATMGSLKRVAINYVDVYSFLEKSNLPKFAADMEGENVYKTNLPENAILVMGNEANGIRKEVYECITSTISIPRFGEQQKTESLNVATATAILLSEFRRKL